MKIFREEKVLNADNFTRLKKLILIRNLSFIEFYTLILLIYFYKDALKLTCFFGVEDFLMIFMSKVGVKMNSKIQ